MAAPQKRQRKVTEYGTQLQEKQKTKQAYGLREKQFRRYFTQASKNRSQTGQTLLELLERRLDNVVFRAGLARSRAQARQYVLHRHFLLNSKRVNISSIIVNVGDIITPVKKEFHEIRQEVAPATWLIVNKKTLEIKVDHLPGSTELPVEFDTQKIVEFYSR